MRLHKFTFYLLLLSLSFLVLPSRPLRAQSPTEPDSLILEIINKVSRDSIASYIQTLQDFGTRYAYTFQCDSAGRWLYKKFKGWGLKTKYDRLETYKETYGWHGPFDIFFLPDGQHGWISGGWALQNGFLYTTSDGGRKWSVTLFDKNNGWPSALAKMYFLNKDVGWIVGAVPDYILKTVDGGVSWSKISYGLIYCTDIEFTDEMNGWLADLDYLAHTTDGGISWVKWRPGCYYDIEFISPDTGFVVGRVSRSDTSVVLRTTDGGATWQESFFPSLLYKICFVDKNTGWISGPELVLKTVDGGVSWEEQNYDQKGIVYFIDQDRGWLIKTRLYEETILFHTADGGKTWTQLRKFDVCVGYNDFSFIDTSECWMISENNVFHSSDGGRSWTDEAPRIFWENIVATLPGEEEGSGEYIICAHYDSDSDEDPWHYAPGANDNASGVAAVLEAARVLRGYKFKHTIKFVCFTGEEEGLIGSEHYAYSAWRNNENILGVINLDMIASSGPFSHRMVLSGGSGPLRDEIAQISYIYDEELDIVYDPWYPSDQLSFLDHGFDAIAVHNYRYLSPPHNSQYDVIDSLDIPAAHRITRAIIAALAELSQLVETPVEGGQIGGKVPNTVSLVQNYPNPFNSQTIIRYYIPDRLADERVSLKIYNIKGQLIKTLVDATRISGENEVLWDGRDTNGNEVSSGVYIVQLKVAHFATSRKILLIK